MGKINFKHSISILLLLCPIMVRAQFFAEQVSADTSVLTPKVQEFGLKFNSIAFFKNNEYFHPLVEGYTLPGFQLQPTLYYKADDKFTLEAGVHLSQFSGKKGLNSTEPLFRATYSPTKTFSILLGWLQGTYHHQLIEPLFQWERMYTHPLEYGVQFLVNKNKFKLDTWIDWEHYIELNDPFQEELTFGTSSKILLLNKGDFQLWLPLQATIKHQGGQITTLGDPLKTLVNGATGFTAGITTQNSFIKKYSFDFYYLGYVDFSPQKKQAFKNGTGRYFIVSADITAFKFALGYWRGNDFISPKGEPLLLSISQTDPGRVTPDRFVVTFKSSYYKQVFKNISFGAYFESYYDVNISQFDYDYGISMAISGDVLFGRGSSK